MPDLDLNDHEIEALLAPEIRQLQFPCGEIREITATRHHWLAYEELLTVYGWEQQEFLRLVQLESKATRYDFSTCFCAVVAYAYSHARRELAELVGADVSLPLLVSPYPNRETTH